MKKIIVLIVVLVMATLIIFQLASKPDNKYKSTTKPIAVKENSSAFNESFEKLLNSYYSLKDALVASDTAKATVASKSLQDFAQSLAVEQIQGDTSGVIKETAKSFTGTITGSAIALAGEKTLEAKRKEFEMITDAMLNLTRTVRYDGEKIYYQYCPMAFNNKGAYWLSAQREIRNPYFGDQMLDCGSVEDSLDYKK